MINIQPPPDFRKVTIQDLLKRNLVTKEELSQEAMHDAAHRAARVLYKLNFPKTCAFIQSHAR